MGDNDRRGPRGVSRAVFGERRYRKIGGDAGLVWGQLSSNL